MKLLSNCCNRPVTVQSSRSGTNHYQCTSCETPCDAWDTENPLFIHKTLKGCFDGLRGQFISMTLDQARSASHQGECDADVETLAKVESIKIQLNKFSPDDLQDALRESGGWEENELQDHEKNKLRALWIAAGDICAENPK